MFLPLVLIACLWTTINGAVQLGMQSSWQLFYKGGRVSGTRHSYPPTTGLSGNSKPPTIGNTHHHGYRTNVYHKEVHHYHYSPPQQIHYGSTYHPVYHGSPPVYIYEYRNSGSRFDTLLTGLALYNLGRMSGSHRNHQDYISTPGEICKLRIERPNGEYEETRVDCRVMSSFILESDNTQTVAKTVTVDTSITNNSGETVRNTTVINAIDVKGPSIHVTQGMNCFMIHIRASMKQQRKVDCALLQEYAKQSLRASSFRSLGSGKIVSFLLFSLISVRIFILKLNFN
ncbi:unnamed protein product [Leptosia nina]|uniref:Uncharacterized protein n=1 Tax=Leptosia nina TaxID=320188 RepID=A0AAV1K5B0_9NEOP